MRIASVTIRDFRKLAGTWQIGPLDPQLTVIGGDNEEGKSTILLALKAALFEAWSVGGRARAAMHAHTGGTPRIELVFELGGTAYRLEKEFGRSCLLSSRDGRFTGDQAEAKLQQLLRFTRRSGKSERGPEHQGLLALFWVDQGTSFLPTTTEAALEPQRDRIMGALRRELEVITAGPRLAALRSRIKTNAARFFTDKGRERQTKDNPLAAVRAELRALDEELAHLRELRKTYDATVDRLQEARAALDRARDPQRRAEAEARYEQARAQSARLAELEQAHKQQLAIVQREDARLKHSESELLRRSERRQRLERAESTLKELEQRRAELDERLRAAEQEALARDEDQSRLAQEAVDARARLARARAARALLERRDQLQRLRALCDELERAEHEMQRIGAELSAITVDRGTVEQLRNAAQKLAERAAVLQAQASRIEFFPDAGRTVRRLDGSAVAIDRPLDLTAPIELLLEGFGRIRITPGADLAAAQRALEEDRRSFHAMLARAGVTTLEAAEEALRRRSALAHALEARKEQIATLLRSVGATDASGLRARLDEEERRFRALESAVRDGDDPERLAAHVGALELAVQTLEERLAEARDKAHAAGEALAALRQERAAMDGQFRTLVDTVTELRAAELEDQARISDADLEAERERAAERLANARAHLGAIEAELEGLDPETVRARVARAEAELAGIAEEIARAQREVDRLEGELEGLGLKACAERLDELERRRAALEEQARALEREARAWKLLEETLAAEERRISESLLEPARRRFLPYVQRLFPAAEPVLDPQRLLVTGLRRGGVEEPLVELSVGTREQLAVLVRLALADLLLEHEGEAPCLVLDDALVFSDEERFARMKRILAEAAERMQILVLTCRPREWCDMPGLRLRLEDCRAGSSIARVAEDPANT